MDDIRIKFREMLESISLPDNDNNPIQGIESIQNLLLTNTPKRLFRYRPFNENSLSAFLHDEIWASKPDAFNDPFDSYPGVDLIEIVAALDGYLGKEVREKILPTDVLLKLLIEAFQDVVNVGSINNIACFSENDNSSLMWAHYADSYKGFVLEYNFTEINGLCQVVCEKRDLKKCNKFEMAYPLFPVIYDEKKFNAIIHFLWFILDKSCTKDKFMKPDILISIKPFLYKNKTWEYEKEWRLLTEINPKSVIKPKAVYITDKISKINRYVIEKIANDKNIPVKLMELNLFDLKYVLIEKPLTQITNHN